MQETFFAMERRRIERQAGGGRMVERGIFAFGTEMAVFFGLGLYGLASIRIRVFGSPDVNLRYLALPVLLTAWVVGMALHQSWSFRENLPLVWAKTWGWLLVIWALWVYQPDKHTCKPDHRADYEDMPFIFGEQSAAEVFLFVSFLVLEAITLIAWIVIVKLYPTMTRCCFAPFGWRWYWRVRPSRKGEGWISYRPNGPLSLKRFRCQYQGSVDAEGRPHGHGVWRDDSHHGEVLEGEWSNGLPSGRFVSRTFGTGALSMGLEIGYSTARAEGLSQLWLCPRRAQGPLRYGVLQVECSAAGGFLSHLPHGMAHAGHAAAASVVEDMQQSANAARLTLTRRASVCQDGPALELDTGSFGMQRALSWDAPEGGDALVFVHGYNCPLDWACMRLGQLLALGKFPPEVLPVVFSWPSGGSIAYFQARSQLAEAAPDFVDFLHGLRAAGRSNLHIIAHSMGCELVTAALPQMQSLVRDGRLSAGTGDTGGQGGGFGIPTITLFNGTCPQEAFLAAGGHMSQLLSVCTRLTLYNDADDTALWFTELIGRREEVIGRHTAPWPAVVAQRFTAEERARVDIVDCTSMDANVGGVRHNYFNLQPHIVGDLQELVCFGRRASRRSRLVRTSVDQADNVFAFLAPPVFVSV